MVSNRDDVKYSGAVSLSQLIELGMLPDDQRMSKGAVAILECVQQIPCNPCEIACPRGAIKIGENITDLPKLDGEKCNGCGICAAKCPGLAIFIVDINHSEDSALVGFPYEYTPLPTVDAIVACSDREGKYICDGAVAKVISSTAFDHTAVVYAKVPKAHAMSVRSIIKTEVM